MVKVTRLRPLEVTMVFKDRSYKLGETIDIDLELKARRDVEVREGRVDLLCQERYKQTLTVTVTKSARSGLRRGYTPTTFKETKQVTHARNESYSHSGAVFLTDTGLRSGETGRHRVRLEIGPEPPQHMSDSTVREAKVSWALVAAFDLAQARDVTERQPTKVALV